MTVTPYTGPEDPVGPNGDIAGSGSGSGSTPPANAQIPDLTMLWDSVPDIVPTAASGSGSGKSSTPKEPVSKDFSVDLGVYARSQARCSRPPGRWSQSSIFSRACS